MRHACGISYLGARYAGWQAQKSILAIQNLVDNALSQIAASPITTICAGRTDTGVHALGQVIHFDSPSIRTTQDWVRGANSFLPEDILMKWCQPVKHDFHARYTAISRTYHYVISNSDTLNILWHNRCLNITKNLNHLAMNQACSYLLGKQDFSSFRASGCQAHSSVRSIINIDVSRYNTWILLRIQADAFLYHMVRNIVGSLLEVGLGKSPEWFRDIIAAKDRKQAAPTASAQGLYLMQVCFPKQYDISEDLYHWDWYES